MRLTMMCASHIDSLQRLDVLKRCIVNVENLKNIERLIVGLSCEHDMIELVDAFVTTFTTNVIFIRSKHMARLTQFQHFHSILHYHPFEKGWIMFCDDDDMSHPTRAIAYAKALESLGDNKKEKECSMYCEKAQKCILHDDAYEMSLDDIDAHDSPTSNGGQEYFMFAVTFDILRYFCERCGLEILKLHECDLMFRNFLRCLPCHIFDLSVILGLEPKRTSQYWLYAKMMRKVVTSTDAHIEALGVMWRNVVVPRLQQHPRFNIRHVQKFIDIYQVELCREMT